MPAKGTPTPPLVGGNSARQNILEGYVFQSGLHKPEHSSILTYKYPQYYLTSLLDRMGASEAVSQTVFSWNILDRTREAGTVSSIAGLGTATVTFEVTEFDFVADNLGYLIPGDIIRSETGALLRITAVGASVTLTNKQLITAVKVGGGNITSAEINNAMKFGHAFNAFGEGSMGPIGRVFLPVEDYNVTTILRRAVSITGTEFTNRTWLGDGSSWYWEVEDITMKEFARDREHLVLFGKLSDSGVKVSRGILDWVINEGVTNGYSKGAGVGEEDIMDHIRQLLVEGGSREYVVLCGSKFLIDTQKALRDYAIGGGVNYGAFGSKMLVGLSFHAYEIVGVKAYFFYYELFDDAAVLPFAGTPTATVADFSDFSLWLDFGTDSGGKRLLTLKHKELDGVSRKFIHKVIGGMMSPGGAGEGFAASSFDGFEVQYLSEIGLEVRNANRMGILAANAA
jgi:hypothetical protein